MKLYEDYICILQYTTNIGKDNTAILKRFDKFKLIRVYHTGSIVLEGNFYIFDRRTQETSTSISNSISINIDEFNLHFMPNLEYNLNYLINL